MYHLEPLADKERQQVLESIDMLEAFPDSIRLFYELHDFCFDLIDTRGHNKYKPLRSRHYQPDINTKRGLSFCYAINPFGIDTLSTIHTTDEGKKETVLVRKKGYQTEKKQSKLDELGMMLRGLLPWQTHQGMRSYEAFELYQFIIEPNARWLILEHEY